LLRRPESNFSRGDTEVKQILPRARTKSLIIKELPDETLVYDLETDKAHCLNETAARLWKNCDGKKTVAQLHESMGQGADSPVPEEMVWLALDQLEQFKLLETPVTQPHHLSGMSRRQMIRLVGTAAIAVPVIFSIAAPTAQAASSCATPGSACGSNNQCCSNMCCGSPGVPACPTNNVCV
jgi:hypothetical protein